MSHEWLWPAAGVVAGLSGVVVSHLASLKVKERAAVAKLALLFDVHAPAWRTCACPSCVDRRKQAGL